MPIFQRTATDLNKTSTDGTMQFPGADKTYRTCFFQCRRDFTGLGITIPRLLKARQNGGF